MMKDTKNGFKIHENGEVDYHWLEKERERRLQRIKVRIFAGTVLFMTLFLIVALAFRANAATGEEEVSPIWGYVFAALFILAGIVVTQAINNSHYDYQERQNGKGGFYED